MRSITTALASAAFATVLSAPALAQDTTLRAGVFVPVSTAFGEMCGRFINQLNNEAKGTVQIRLVGGLRRFLPSSRPMQ